MTEDVVDDGLEVLHLVATLGEVSAGESIRVDDLEVEDGGVFLSFCGQFPTADGGE